MQIRPAPNGTVLQTLSEQSGQTVTGLVTGGSAGTINITIINEDTVTYTWTSAVYDLQIDNGIDPEVLLRGGVRVIERVTQ
jgi:hypothetical protein